MQDRATSNTYTAQCTGENELPSIIFPSFCSNKNSTQLALPERQTDLK